LRRRYQATTNQSDAKRSRDVQQHSFDGLRVGSFVNGAEKPQRFVRGKGGKHFEKEFVTQMPLGENQSKAQIAAGAHNIKRLPSAKSDTVRLCALSLSKSHTPKRSIFIESRQRDRIGETSCDLANGPHPHGQRQHVRFQRCRYS
jgi:hypothetical protein